MDAQALLKQLGEKIAEIKTDIAREEGSLSSVMEDIKKRFRVKTIEEAKLLLEEKKIEFRDKQDELTELLKIVEEKIAKYA